MKEPKAPYWMIDHIKHDNQITFESPTEPNTFHVRRRTSIYLVEGYLNLTLQPILNSGFIFNFQEGHLSNLNESGYSYLYITKPYFFVQKSNFFKDVIAMIPWTPTLI